ncbi:hypothetical protein H4R22_005216 [Coemansia sp. RSA 1290]|nr:hypothetical protein H4R22_005216 [Coemansia sp. RSA 1290]
MPRIARERTKYHASTRPQAVVGMAAAASKPASAVPSDFFASILPQPQPASTAARTLPTAAATDIASAPVPLATGTADAEKELPRQTKKAKRVERHKKWLDKLNTAQALQRQQQRQQSRLTDKSALVRGMSQMQSSLRQVQAEMIAADLSGNSATRPKQKQPDIPKSRKARNRAAIQEEQRFSQVLQHPAFKADPLATIRKHLSNTLQQQQQQQPSSK